MLQQIPSYLREQAANSLYFEAQCRIQDPVYGCAGIISKLYEQINSTEIALAHVQTQIACQKLQVPQAKAESNFNVFPAQNSSTAEFQWESQVPWFN
ncbi:LOB domain-containing protein 24 [Glycine soja]|nr:LOB domain-containing protein 24 [Glycine soja]